MDAQEINFESIIEKLVCGLLESLTLLQKRSYLPHSVLKVLLLFFNSAFGEPISNFLARILFCVTFVLVNWDFLKDSG